MQSTPAVPLAYPIFPYNQTEDLQLHHNKSDLSKEYQSLINTNPKKETPSLFNKPFLEDKSSSKEINKNK
jgi:hypothetical protein